MTWCGKTSISLGKPALLWENQHFPGKASIFLQHFPRKTNIFLRKPVFPGKTKKKKKKILGKPAFSWEKHFHGKTSILQGKPAFKFLWKPALSLENQHFPEKKKKKHQQKKKHFPGKISVFLGKQTISHYGNSIDPDHYVHTVSQGSQTLHTEGFNLDHSLGKFSRWQIDIFFYFSQKVGFDIHANWQFAWNVKA